jgi:hypothetical protein
MKRWLLFLLAMGSLANAGDLNLSTRQQTLLSGAGWQFTGAGAAATLPEVGAKDFATMPWQPVSVPHVFQTDLPHV